MTKDLKFLISIVKKAAKLITPNFQVKAKGDKGDLVTNFDYEIEQFLIGKIKKQYPNFHIISEEFNNQEKMSENCFTIDPIDGTINFANGLPLWGIQVACVRNGKTCAAVIFLPAMKEMYYADETGAFMNDKPIHVSNTDFNNVLIMSEVSLSLKQKVNHVRSVFSCAVSFPWVACGRLGIFVLPKVKPWDCVPGLYLAKQAGATTYQDEKHYVVANTEENLKKMTEFLCNKT